MEKITSPQNERIKQAIRLMEKSRERRENKLFTIEGARELSIALVSNYRVETVFLCPEIFEKSEYPDVLQTIDRGRLAEVSPAVFRKMAYRESSDGLIAVAHQKSHTLGDLRLPENPFIIVLEAVEKPGNLGAVLRTADAAAATAVIVCDPLTDIYNPNTIRSGVGCTFSVPTAVCSSEEAFNWLKTNRIKTFAAELEASEFYQNADFTTPSSIVMGTEADGLSSFWLTHADERIKIPMRGRIDSLNLSVSTAVLTFEAMRQRGFGAK